MAVTESRGRGFLIDVESRGHLTDDQLLAASRSDPEAFACLYERYETAIVGYLMRRTGDPELTADLTAEVFAAALTSAARYRRRHPTAAGWLFTIAHNTLAESAAGASRSGRAESSASARSRCERRAWCASKRQRATTGLLSCSGGCLRNSVTPSSPGFSTAAPTRTSPPSFRHRSSWSASG
jgi:hypothetical protein